MFSMKALALVLLSIKWLPLAESNDLVYRIELAQAIVDADTTDHEGRILMRITRFESTLRRDVGDCRVLGDGGRAVGPFQAYDRIGEVRDRICTDLTYAAKVARDDVRMSFQKCSHLPKEERLAIYARGRCESEEGKKLSRVRWWN